MKLLLLCNPQGNQRALANKLASLAPIAAIALVKVNPGRAKRPNLVGRLRNTGRRAASLLVGLPLRKAWFRMLGYYDRLYPAFPTAETLTVDDVNDPEVRRLVERLRPDLVIVSGTNLLKRPLIEAITQTGPVLNLHTGVSPYVKGGPNCTNWCLALQRFDLIGNSVLWLDAGIDSGNLAATARTPLDGTETLTELHIKVMEHAHSLYLECVSRFLRGAGLPNVPQRELGEGRLFLTRDWTPTWVVRAVANFYTSYRTGVTRTPSVPIALVSPSAGITLTPDQDRELQCRQLS